ncbi:hypothetical protein BpHYR1_021668 [Brachionus plicatilis]|uniref:Uncharacterized protein n=1 Tax=Brachionus plicatilis TaxID=10195 RepID=A0A3M7RVA3_BRAPC|nr:hypothetical protein BpHYR1_021668 [Brachionus plicatilis]
MGSIGASSLLGTSMLIVRPDLCDELSTMPVFMMAFLICDCSTLYSCSADSKLNALEASSLRRGFKNAGSVPK